jgi:hypothetical protein
VIALCVVAGLVLIGALTNKSQTPDGSPTTPPAPATTQPATQPAINPPPTPDTPATTVTTTNPASADTPADDSTDQQSTSDGGYVYYANCTAVRAAGKAPLYRGQPGYRSALDRDNDGIACE